MVIPGDVAEMTEFQEKNMNNSRFILELCFPNVQLSLPSKAFYEKLHNRYRNSRNSNIIRNGSLTFFMKKKFGLYCELVNHLTSKASPHVYIHFYVAENEQIR